MRVDQLEVKISESRDEMGRAAALDIHERILALLTQKPEINIIFAAAPSQNEVLEQLTAFDDIDWSRISAYHMDEYIGLSAEDYDKSFLESCLAQGEMPSFSADEASNEIVISQKVASDLGVKVGDKIFAYFMGEENMRARRLTIAGVFETHMADYDENLAVTDIYTVRRLNGWEKEQSSGLEITVHDFEQVDELTRTLHFLHRNTGLQYRIDIVIITKVTTTHHHFHLHCTNRFHICQVQIVCPYDRSCNRRKLG